MTASADYDVHLGTIFHLQLHMWEGKNQYKNRKVIALGRYMYMLRCRRDRVDTCLG